MVRKIFVATCVAALALASTACNTVRGIGQDLESAANDVDEVV